MRVAVPRARSKCKEEEMRAYLVVPLAAALGCAHGEQPPPQAVPQAAAERSTAARATAARSAAVTAAPTEAPVPCPSAEVFFAFDSDELTEEDEVKLDEVAACLKGDARRRVSITGSADERGPTAYNRDLGERRAEAAAQYLENEGVDATQIDIFTNGEESPICNLSAERCWQRNRRAALHPACRM
jgi:peptidoglycan-associated lipoprotein